MAYAVRPWVPVAGVVALAVGLVAHWQFLTLDPELTELLLVVGAVLVALPALGALR